MLTTSRAATAQPEKWVFRKLRICGKIHFPTREEIAEQQAADRQAILQKRESLHRLYRLR